MNGQSLERVYVPGLAASLTFDRNTDFLGKGTVGEVFRATAEQETKISPAPRIYALKIFLDHGERPHFARECKVLKALALNPHPHILIHLHCWMANSFQYILFPIAMGDLHTCFRTSSQPRMAPWFMHWFVLQLRGLCDALKYIHNYAIPKLDSDNNSEVTMHRIGFHHDIKPVNILLFATDNPAEPRWTLSDFGSGLVSEYKAGDHESIYNSKPSTGDPIYTGPEFALEGRVSRPKDVWSLGCIYLEALIWISHSSRTALDDFQQERFNLPGGGVARKPMYWYQDVNGAIHMHPAVSAKMDVVHEFCKDAELLEETRVLVTRMLTIPHRERATAAMLCSGFDAILRNHVHP